MFRKLNGRSALIVGTGVASLAFATAPAHAALMLSYNGGLPITDNGIGDSDLTVGTIVNSTVVGGFGVAITIAASNSPGSATAGIVQVQSLDVYSLGANAATLNIAVSDTGFTQPGGPGSTMLLTSSYGTTLTLGALGDKTVFQSFADPSNAQPPTAASTAALTATRSNAGVVSESFSGVDTTTFLRGASPYSLGNSISITLSPGGQANISGTTVAQVVPEPTTLAAIAGVTMLGFRRRR